MQFDLSFHFVVFIVLISNFYNFYYSKTLMVIFPYSFLLTLPQQIGRAHV